MRKRLRILAYGLVVLGAIGSPCLLTPAYAETIDLKCNDNYNPGPVSYYLSVDTSALTVAFWLGAQPRANATVVPATITDDEVKWGTDQPWQSFTLDRNSGALHYRNKDYSSSHTCKRAERII